MIKRYFFIFCTSMFVMTGPTRGVSAEALEKRLLELERQQKAPPGPQGLSYQAALRGADGSPLTNSTVTMRFSIQTAMDNSGSVEWEETQSVTTNDLGLVTAFVGMGTRTSGAQAVFADIPWSSVNMYLKVEIDLGNGFVDLGTTQLMSVPYAFAADNGISDAQTNKLDGIETGAEVNVQSDWNQADNTADDFIVGKPNIPADINELSDVSGLLTPNSFSGSFSDLTNVPADIADGDDVNDDDADATNEIQDLQLVGNNLTITNNGSATTIDLSPYLDDTDTNTQLTESEVDGFVANNGFLTSEVDGDVTNEIQDLQLVGNMLTITNNGAPTSIDLSPYLDNTDTNTQLSESEVDGFVANNGFLTSEVDGDATNEIQDLQLVGNNLTITNNGSATTIDLSPYLDNTDTNTQLTESEVDGFVANNGFLTSEVDGDATNEIQDLQLIGNNLTITNNGSATTIDISPYLDNTDTQLTESEVDGFVANNGFLTSEVDGDATNEIQDLQLVGNMLTITNNGAPTSIDLSPYLDDTDTNTQLSESEVDGFVANNGFLTSEVDGDATNEIQDLQLVGNMLTITNNGAPTSIDLSPYLDDTDTNTQLSESEVDGFVANNGFLTSEVDGDASNEIQDLQLVGNILTITNNGAPTSIDLSPYLDDTDTNTQLSESEVDGFVANNGFLTSEVFSTTTNIILNNDPSNESFLVGSSQFNDDADATHDKRMFFEKSTGAFRVGGAQSTQWDSRGSYSFAAGRNNSASGNRSAVGGGSLNISSSSHTVVAGGYGNYATGNYAAVVGGSGNRASSGGTFVGGGGMNNAVDTYTTVSGGYRNYANAEYASIGGGWNNTANGRRSTIPGGYGIIANSFAETVIGTLNNNTTGTSNSFVATDQLFVIGNGTSSGNRSDALVMLKNGNTTLNGSLEVNTTTGAFILPRMTTTERDALTAVNGMLIYNTTTNQIEGYENGTWIDI